MRVDLNQLQFKLIKPKQPEEWLMRIKVNKDGNELDIDLTFKEVMDLIGLLEVGKNELFKRNNKKDDS